MLLTAFILWWYGQGWVRQVQTARDSLASTYDFFSIDLLAKTLFSPYRQISAGKVQGSFEVIFRAWVDRLVSRLIGAMLRIVIIVVGVVSIVLMALFAAFRILLWPLLPAVPVICILFAMTGVKLWTL